jgi:3-oxoacyl-[acyl-carrier protein] reductase
MSVAFGALDSRVALVTGGSRGIGRAIAVELASAGAAVSFTYRSSPGGADDTRKRIEEQGAPSLVLECDVAELAAVDAAVRQTLDHFGRLDILVNNAGTTRDQLLARMSPDDFDRVIATNLRGTWNFCRAAIRPMLRARWGRIVSLSSVVASSGNPGQTNYAASKGGIEALTLSLAREVGSRGITVNAIAPGLIETDMTQDLPESVVEGMRERIPLGRLGAAEDVARVVRFLVSDEAAYITGQVIRVNGGLD